MKNRLCPRAKVLAFRSSLPRRFVFHLVIFSRFRLQYQYAGSPVNTTTNPQKEFLKSFTIVFSTMRNAPKANSSGTTGYPQVL